MLLFALAPALACSNSGACASREIRGAWDPTSCARAGCPRSATGDAARGCTCASGTELVLGACVSPALADAYCGKGARFEDGACVFKSCPDAQLFDVANGACVPLRAARELAAAQRIGVFEHETLGCEGNASPVVDGPRIACLPARARCPRGTRAVDARASRCDPAMRCGAGEIAEADASNASGRCVALLTAGSRSAPYAVDVGAWSRAVLGPDGGDGSASLCAPLALRPSTVGVDARHSLVLRVAIELRFPESDVTLATATTTAIDDASGAALPSAGALVDDSVRALVETLRALGGEASAAATKTTVRCRVASEDRPFGVPRAPPPTSTAK